MLPAGTAHKFTEEVIPLARELLGTLDPWARLTIPQMQSVVDRVFKPPLVQGKAGPSLYKVTADNEWSGLLGYRTTDWHNNFAKGAVKAMEALIKVHKARPSEKPGEELDPAQSRSDGGAVEPDPTQGESDVDAAEELAATEEPIAAEEPAKWRALPLDTPEGRAKFVEWAFEESGDTRAFHWETWGHGVKKEGFFFSYLILYTFHAHLAVLDQIPAKYAHSTVHPYSALLLAVQAVERNLKYTSTGDFKAPPGLPGQFSFDNYGDIKERVSATKNRLTRRTTKFLAVLKGWDADQWEEFLESSAELREQQGRGAPSSRGTSEVEDMEDTEEEEEVVVVSD
ncbi:hypothetical protein B0H17DRAFT_1099330 [Mycena rosella]|uniref:Uncharacterized protein n=1 Tax=Mycena rosella TaxID=1033263 RepID=A0AAD7CPD5_MYCRO|nr:hypothetical protein B0H17DRAFT_1099330 [Mycena rosella]